MPDALGIWCPNARSDTHIACRSAGAGPGRPLCGALSGATRTARELRSHRADCGAFSHVSCLARYGPRSLNRLTQPIGLRRPAALLLSVNALKAPIVAQAACRSGYVQLGGAADPAAAGKPAGDENLAVEEFRGRIAASRVLEGPCSDELAGHEVIQLG